MIIALSTSILLSALVHLSWTNTGNFTIIPSSEVVAVGQRAVFRCRHPTAISIVWMVNNSIIGRTPPPGIIPDTTGGSDNLVDILTIMARLEFNQTKVVCEARFNFVTTPPERAPPVYLLIQGNLGMGSNIRRSSSTVTWEPPFSLDLTDVDPDIVYCVEVYNITCGVDDLVVGGCNVTETHYEDNRLQQGHIYRITITPRSNIGQNAQNGTLFTKKEMFVSLTDPMTRIVLTNGTAMVSTVIQFKNDDAVVDRIEPESYFLSLQAIDGVKEPLMSLATSFTQDMNTTTLSGDQPLPRRRLWNYQVLALGCIENPVTDLLELSTHEFQNIIVNSISPGEISVTGNFINGSTAAAVLVIIYSDSDVYYVFSSPSEEETNVRGLPSGLYNVSVFVVEENGLPFNTSATTPRSVSVMEGKREINFQIVYEVQSMSTGVCITCTFLDSSATDCVAVIHQQISQLGSSGLMNIVRSQKFNMSGSNAFGCIPEVDLDQYQVGIVGGRLVETLPNQDSQVEIIVGVTVGILVPAVGLAAVSVIVVVTWKTKKKRSGQDVHGESGGSSSMRPLTKGAAHLQDETEAPAYAVLHRGPSQPAEVEGLVLVPTTYSVLDQYPPKDLDPDPSSAASDLAYATVGPSPASREMVPQEFDHTVVEYSRVQ